MNPADRTASVCVGLSVIAANVCEQLMAELEACKASDLRRASVLLANLGREEAGKFLILIDIYRSPGSVQETVGG